MDPFSIVLCAGQIAGGCTQAAATIAKFCDDVKTVDTRIRGFDNEVTAFCSTYEGLSKSLETPILLEAARVASKTPNGAQLWDQVRIALDDSLRTVNRINRVLDTISKKASFARKVKTVLGENLRDGELYRLRQRVQFFNVTISLPIQTMCLMLQLEQRDITTEHQRLLESKLTSLERDMQHLVNHPDRMSMYSGATLIVGTVDENPGLTRGETYLSFAKKMLSTASAAASTRPSLSTVSPQIDRPTFFEVSGSEPWQQQLPGRGKTIPDWVPHPETPSNSRCDIYLTNTSGVAPLEGQRKSAEVTYKLTQQHLKLGQEKAEKNEHESAEKFFRKALQLLAKHDFSGRIVFQPAEVVLLLSKSCLEQKKYDEAIELLHPVAERQANIISQSTLPASAKAPTPISTLPEPQVPDSLQALAASHLLGEAYKLKGDFESAKEHALTAFLQRMDELGEHDQKTRESVKLVIEIYQLMGDEEDAEAYQVFLTPIQPHPTSPVSSNVLPPEQVVLNRGQTVAPSIGPKTPDAVNSSNLRRESNRPSFTKRLRNMARSSQPAPYQPTSDYGIHGLSFSPVGTGESIIPDTSPDSRRSQYFSCPSDTSHDPTNSFGDADSSAPSISHREGSASVRRLDPKFLAVEQLCDSGSYDQAVKIALKFLEGYDGSNFIIRKDEMEKNIRKGNGKGLASTGKGYSPLHYMCELKQEYMDEVRLMLKYGANVNATAGKASYGTKSNEVLTPLQLAIDRGHSGISQLLLETPGIRTDIQSGEHWYPLLRAGRKRQYGTVKLLLKHGPSSIPKTYPQNYYGCSPLHDAAKHCDLSLVEIFLDHGHVDPDKLNVNIQDKFGKTALMHAVIKSDVSHPEAKARTTRQRREVIEALLNAGADIQILDFEGHSARWYAERECPPDKEWLCKLVGVARASSDLGHPKTDLASDAGSLQSKSSIQGDSKSTASVDQQVSPIESHNEPPEYTVVKKRPQYPLPITEDLWERAKGKLAEHERGVLEANIKIGATKDILADVHTVVEEKQKLVADKMWKINFGGRKIVLRDLVGKIAGWITTFQDVGEFIAGLDPVHCVLPWAGIKLFVISDIEQAGQILVGVELVTSLINRCRIYEQLYITTDQLTDLSELGELQKNIVLTYTGILSFLVSFLNLMDQNNFTRTLSATVDTEAINEKLVDLGKYENRSELTAGNYHYNAAKDRVRVDESWLRRTQAGAGKTKLSTKVVGDILGHATDDNNDNDAFAFFSCDRTRTGHQDPVMVLRNLVRQLSTPRDEATVIACVEAKYMQRKRTGFASDLLTSEECQDLLVRLIDDYAQCRIVLDGLDECDIDTRYVLMDTIDLIVANSAQPVKIYLASRQDLDLRERYLTGSHLEVTTNDNQADMEKCVLKQQDQSPFCRTKLTAQVREQILKTFQEKNQGIKRDVAFSVVKILMCSWRSLSPAEMVIAAAQDTHKEFYLDPDVDIDYILDACHNEVVVADGLPGRMLEWHADERYQTKVESKRKYTDVPSSKYQKVREDTRLTAI
ncbi:hypothetical protein DV736_g5503, partial [Chaetothyriales sp. CBS 134916]